MKWFLTAITVAVCILVSLPAHAQCSAADTAALEAFDRNWGDVSLKGDRAAVEAIYADDFAGIEPAGLTGKARVVEETVADAERARKSGDTTKVVHDYYVISCTPLSATITHRNVVTPGEGGMARYTRSVHFLEKRGGRWQVVSNATHSLDDAMVLAYMEREWVDSDVKRDAAWKEKNFASDYTSVGSRNGALSSKSDEIEDTKNGKWTLESGSLSELDVRVDRNFAVVTGIFHGKGTGEDKKPFSRDIRFTDTYVKRDGRWLAWASQGTPVTK